ncbi:MAG: serpin family protein [Deltaproteobacteria bacterium]|nr:serpin family protein [Deltaproteobacteria bacterium]
MRIELFLLSALLLLPCLPSAAQAQEAAGEAASSGAAAAAAPAVPAAEAPAAPAAEAPAAPADKAPAAPADEGSVAPAAVSAEGAPAAQGAGASSAAEGTDAAVPAEAAALASGLEGFAWKLYQALPQDDGNVLVSPLSAAEALSMSYLGASGATADELAGALGFPYKGEELQKAWKGLRASLALDSGKGDPLFRLADSLWPDKSLKLRQGFLDSAADAFGPAVYPVDFAGDAADAQSAVNDWTLDATDGKINGLLASPPPPETRLLLVNAVYFKGLWEEPFNPEATEDGEFWTAGGPVKARFMRRLGAYGYLEDELGQALEIPYEGGRLSMVFLLLKEGEPTRATREEPITGDALSARLKGLSKKNVEAVIPKFSFGWGSFSLKGPLASLGVKEAFADTADFSGLAEGPGLKISEIFHKSFIDVNEEGAEAAAATSVAGTVTSAPLPAATFRADRPFVFFIRDNPTGATVFVGRLADPSAR